jgi:hypothetical protein
MAGSRKKEGGEDFGELQARMTRAILMELRNDVEDLLAGLEAGSIDYVQALKALKIQLLESLKDPLVGAVDVNYTKVMVPTDNIDVPPALKKKKKPRRK